MKTSGSMSIVMIALILILMLCSFSYAGNDGVPESLEPGSTFTVNGQASDFDQLSGSFTVTSDDKQYTLTVPRDFKILIDGKIGSLENVEMISSYKALSVSVLGGSNILYVNTCPQKYDAEVISAGYEGGNLTAALNVDQVKMILVSDINVSDTDISSGDSIVLIADGCKIIEVRKK